MVWDLWGPGSAVSGANGGHMSGRLRVFISYKKDLIRRANGHETSSKNVEAHILNELLGRSAAYEPRLDRSRVTAGMSWETEIYEMLLSCDVLICLIGPGTSRSEWVRREISLATALGISIVPVGFDLTENEMSEETHALSLGSLQWTITHNIDLGRGPALLAELNDALELAAEKTRRRQTAVLGDLWERRRRQRRKAEDNQRASSFVLTLPKGSVAVHVASGDLARVRNVDAIVNSENDYMQMARFFESNTVSSMLRRRGSRIRGGRFEDVIQHELDWQLRGRGRPVQAAEVFPTSAGGPDSDLARLNKARVILHVAAVQAVAAENRVVPFRQPHQIISSVRAVLSALGTINESSGVFSKPRSPQRVEQENMAGSGMGELTSVIFPLLGTGTGGAAAADVIDPILDGITGFLSEEENESLLRTLQDIYISALYEDDVRVVTAALTRRMSAVS